ncbi:acyl-CoA thioesterase [Chitinophaga barathri]|uniref:Thioesterase n=1 Tax=Chitinophaga barathri TaxID=1647451 RepID=A0A3N4ML08_9BACT|nr:thioesterase family protein [Chitinophaga barathri]RPD40750.1 thioesterase [Chitinophaga barathri]
MARVKIDMPAVFRFSTVIPVRITDVNYGGHLGNDAIVSILHESRMQYLGSLGCTELDFFGTSLIMADLAVMYKGEGFYGDALTVEVAADELSSLGYDLYYRLSTTRDGKQIIVAEAKTGMVCFDYKTRKVARLPELFKQQIDNTTA